MFDTDSAKSAQLLSAKARSENARMRSEIREYVKRNNIKTLLSDHGLVLNLSNEVKQKILTDLLPSLILESFKHRNHMESELLRHELGSSEKNEISEIDTESKNKARLLL